MIVAGIYFSTEPWQADGTTHTCLTSPNSQKAARRLDDRLYGSRFRYDDYDSVNWDGTYVTLSNPSTHSIYRVQISHKVKIVGRTRVHGWIGGFGYSASEATKTWLKDGKFIAQWGSGPQLAIWSYPAGGKPTKVLPPFASTPTSVDGVVLSPGRR